MDFIMQLRQAQGGTFVLSDGTSWKVPNVLEIPVTIDGCHAKRDVILEGSWMIPTRWNQGGYDAACLLKCPHREFVLRFIQVTMAVSHDLNLKYFEELATTISQGLDIAIPAIEIYFVVPATSPEVTVRSVKSAGRLSSWKVGCCRSKTCWTKGREEEEVHVVIFKSTNTK